MITLKTVPSFPNYTVNVETGDIFSKRGKLKPTLNNSGYHTVTLYQDGVSKSTTVHRVVMAAFLGTWEWEKPEVDHKDHVRTHNSIHNLKLATKVEQMNEVVKGKLSAKMKGNSNHSKEAVSIGVRGSKNNKAKLTEAAALDILNSFKNSGLKVKSKFVKEYALKYGVSESAVYRVLSGNKWSHVKNTNVSLEIQNTKLKKGLTL